MSRVIEELAGDWRHLDARIEGLTDEIETLARQDQHCERLMTVPGIGPIISSAMVAAIGTGDVFSKGRDFGAWLGLVPKQISTGDRQSSAAYQGAAIAICVSSSFRRPGSCWSSSPSSGNAMGSSRGSRRRRSDCTTTCSLSRWPVNSPASPGRFSTRDAPSRATRPMRWRPVQHDPRRATARLHAQSPGRRKERPPGTN